MRSVNTWKYQHLIEIYWGEPLSLTSPDGGQEAFSTIEKARYWLSRKWPVTDQARRDALHAIDAAMDCLALASRARIAFSTAARSAGFVVCDRDRIALPRAA